MEQRSHYPSRVEVPKIKVTIRKKLTKEEYKLYSLRGELIKKKQNLESWMWFYKQLESLDTYKPEHLRYTNSIRVKAQWEEVNNKLEEIEKQIKN